MTISDWVVVGLFVAGAIVDVALVLRDKPSITETLKRVSMKRPVVPFGVGFLCGHVWGCF